MVECDGLVRCEGAVNTVCAVHGVLYVASVASCLYVASVTGCLQVMGNLAREIVQMSSQFSEDVDEWVEEFLFLKVADCGLPWLTVLIVAYCGCLCLP